MPAPVPTELESKYTQFVVVHSRPVWPRLDFGPLARVLNALEVEGEAHAAAWTATLIGAGHVCVRVACAALGLRQRLALQAWVGRGLLLLARVLLQR